MENEKIEAVLLGNMNCPECEWILVNDREKRTTSCENDGCVLLGRKFKLPTIELIDA